MELVVAGFEWMSEGSTKRIRGSSSSEAANSTTAAYTSLFGVLGSPRGIYVFLTKIDH